jgi:hypothetical protein
MSFEFYRCITRPIQMSGPSFVVDFPSLSHSAKRDAQSGEWRLPVYNVPRRMIFVNYAPGPSILSLSWRLLAMILVAQLSDAWPPLFGYADVPPIPCLFVR